MTLGPVVVRAVTKCAAGKKFVANASPAKSKCEDCTTGTFNAADDQSTTCVSHNQCTGQGVATEGDLNKDADCNVGTISS